MAELPEEQAAGQKTWLQKLGDLRDPFLVLASVIYGVGYFVWSIHAYQEDLGLLPALEPQYLVAGVVPVLILWIAWLGRGIPRRCTDWISSRVARAKGWQVQARLVVGMLLLFGGYYVLSVANKYSISAGMSAEAARWQIAKENLLLVLAYLLMIPGFLFLGATFFAKIMMYFVTVLYATAFLLIYIFSIYPNIPQEFGGVRPRCAYVDITRNQISDAMQKEVLPEGALKSTDAVARTVRLKTYFADKEIMLVRPDAAGKHAAVIEIRKSTVQAVSWCD
ncbi:MAG TPA: hypothetical protein VH724_05495 [Candidatus Angelobacter sp.]|nr:hypothetical protein [Candidatus Angelobacter sp.]